MTGSRKRSNIVHSLGLKQIRALLKKVHRAMIGGGLIIVKDFFIDESRTRPVASALFAVQMLVATRRGNCYTPSEIKAALREAGFAAVSSRRVPRHSCLYLGRKG
jgi:hypothetical protein